MAYVIIPSKNTYQKKHPFQKNNVISKISVSAMGEVDDNNNIKNQSKTDFNSQVFSYKPSAISTPTNFNSADYIDFNVSEAKDTYGVWFSGFKIDGVKTQSYNSKTIYNNKSEDGYFINKATPIEEGNITATYKKTTEKCDISADLIISQIASTNAFAVVPTQETKTITSKQEEFVSRFEKPTTYTKSFEKGVFNGIYDEDDKAFQTTINIGYDFKTTIPSLTNGSTEGQKWFSVGGFKVVKNAVFFKRDYEFEVSKGGALILPSATGLGEIYNWTKSPVFGQGEIITYELQEVVVNVNGDKISLNLEEKEQDYVGDSNLQGKYEQEDVISFGSGNELFQKTSYINGKATIPNEFSQSIFKHYRNGKETATILCGINDYFYNDNQNSPFILVDNPQGGTSNRITFDLHDKVIPMVYTAQGKDVPMSYNSDGTPKAFQVLGVRYFYDGAVWQELNLQEI